LRRSRHRRTTLRWLAAAIVLATDTATAGCGFADTERSPASPGTGGAAPFDPAGWRTDFARHSVPLETISAAGPPRDGIPPLDKPRFTSSTRAAGSLNSREPLIAVVIAGRARAYPLQILLWHEIVNDTLGGVPIAVTYCPLCNTAIVFDRRVSGRLLTFGTTGNLRRSDLVMWDRQTQSWWQQFDGHAIVGALTGSQLVPLSSQTLSFADFRGHYPQGDVLSQDTGFDRQYGENPYVGYDSPGQRPFLYHGKLDPRLPPLERVEAITIGQDSVVVPFDALRAHPVTAVSVAGTPAVVVFRAEVLSPLDAGRVSQSRAVGAASAFDARVHGRTLTFRSRGSGTLTDLQTSSRWDTTGVALSGPLRGTRLRRLADLQAFWFAVAAFLPHARVVAPQGP